MKFEEQSFVVIGGARPEGIGLNFVKELLTIGVRRISVFDVVDPCDTIDKLKLKYRSRRILFHKVDVRSKTQIENAFKETVNRFDGRVDVLANFAAICDESRAEDLLLINLLGVIYSTFIGIDHMSVKNGGHGGMIVNVASVAGLDPFYRCPIYSGTKSGVIAFTRALSHKEFEQDYGIKFVLICPGGTNTQMLKTCIPLMFGTFDNNEERDRIIAHFGSQEPEQCVQSLIQALKESENGSTWILDQAKHTAVNYTKYYK